MKAMKTKKHREKREYHQGARAEASAATLERILNETVELMISTWIDQITLERIAERAGVTVQTIIRRFGSRDEVVREASALIAQRMRRDDANPPVGNLNQALDELIIDYERDGDFFIRSLAQEERQPLMPP